MPWVDENLLDDPDALRAAFAAHGDRVAALLMEPVNYDQGCIEPLPGFAQLCRDLCHRRGRARGAVHRDRPARRGRAAHQGQRRLPGPAHAGR